MNAKSKNNQIHKTIMYFYTLFFVLLKKFKVLLMDSIF